MTRPLGHEIRCTSVHDINAPISLTINLTVNVNGRIDAEEEAKLGSAIIASVRRALGLDTHRVVENAPVLSGSVVCGSDDRGCKDRRLREVARLGD